MQQIARFFPIALLAACALGGDDSDGESTGDATSGELRVRVGEMTLWVDRAITWEKDDDWELVATIHGRTSRNLTGVSSWVPDDAFGTATIVGPRSFEIRLQGPHETNSILSGLPLFVAIDVNSGTPRHYEARIDLEVGLGRFSGTADMWVDGSLVPLYAGPEDEPLRYRAGVATESASLTVEDVGMPTVTANAAGFAVDWNYPDIEASITDRAVARFVLADGSSKSARFEMRTRAIDMTLGDPRETWPSACDPAVLACMQDTTDLATCGSYRQVTTCFAADVCEILGSAPLGLDPIDLELVWADARDAYVDGCGSGGQWCSVESTAAFTTPACVEPVPTIGDIVTEAIGDDQDWGGDPFPRGTVLDRARLRQSPLFGSSYSAGGPAFFDAIDAHMGGGALEAWALTEEVPCPNCTDFRDVYVLWYPDAARVIVVEAGHGYDS